MLCAGMLFQINFMRHSGILCFSSWLVEGLVTALTTVILNTFSYFTFHNFHLHSLYKIVSLVFFGGECIIVKKVISEQYTSAVLSIYVFL